jgi:hypothetical protein
VNVSKLLAQLRKERDQIDEAVLSIERLARSRGKPRRPPKVNRAGAAIRLDAKLADAITTRRKLPNRVA